MPVEFEEENFTFNTENTAEGRYEARVKEVNTPFMKTVMVFFAIACVVLAFYIPSYINPHKKQNIVYIEDLTEARMRLLPPDQIKSLLSKLPSRGAATSDTQAQNNN